MNFFLIFLSSLSESQTGDCLISESTVNHQNTLHLGQLLNLMSNYANLVTKGLYLIYVNFILFGSSCCCCCCCCTWPLIPICNVGTSDIPVSNTIDSTISVNFNIMLFNLRCCRCRCHRCCFSCCCCFFNFNCLAIGFSLHQWHVPSTLSGRHLLFLDFTASLQCFSTLQYWQ